MDSEPGRDGEAQFHPRPNAALTYTVLTGFILLLGCGSVALPFLEDNPTIRTYFLSATGLFFFWLAFMLFRLRGTCKLTWAADANGLRELSGTGAGIRWAEVADIEIMEGGTFSEIRVAFIDQAGRKALTVRCDSLQDGGRGLVDELRRRLGPIFERHARQYLSGEKKWGMGIVKDALRIDGGMVYFKYPKTVVVPLSEIQKVEWLPGPISGARTGGFVIIDHAGGRIELPQSIKGIQYFLYCLKYMCGLGERVDAAHAHASQVRINDARAKQSRVSMWRLTAIFMIIFPMFYYFRDLPEMLEFLTIEQSGKPAKAVIVDIEGKSVVLKYKDRNGTDQEITVNARREFLGAHHAGETIPVRIDPVNQRNVYFKGKMGWDRRGLVIISLMTLAMVCAGIGLLIWIGVRKKKYDVQIKQLELEAIQAREAAAPPAAAPAPFAAGPAEYPLSNLAPSSSPPSPGGPGACSVCGRPIEDDYFMLDGAPWCNACHAKESTIKPKLTFMTFMRAVVFGMLAAILGGGLWAATTIITGYELGIVAIFVGLIVGYGIRLGGRQTGGRVLQILALIMTFYTLAYANIPILAHLIMNDPDMRQQFSEALAGGGDGSNVSRRVANEDELDTATLALLQKTMSKDGVTTANVTVVEYGDEATSPAAAGFDEEMEEAGADENPYPNMTPGKAILLLLLLLVGVVTIGPPVIYILLIVSSPLTAVFLAIALWEAWRINRRVDRVFAGPFKSREVIEFDKVDSVAP